MAVLSVGVGSTVVGGGISMDCGSGGRDVEVEGSEEREEGREIGSGGSNCPVLSALPVCD